MEFLPEVRKHRIINVSLIGSDFAMSERQMQTQKHVCQGHLYI